MPDPSAILRQINRLIAALIEVGLSSHQKPCFQRSVGPGPGTEVTFAGAEAVSVALKNRSYREIYDHLAKESAYLLKLPDGALIQMMYRFAGGELAQHRLAFFPSPYLEEFQNNPDLYLRDEIYADIVARNIVPFPLRFDFDARTDIHRELDHPKSHLTLGQYENCRIPVSAPLTPFRFLEFILRNFYHVAHRKYAEQLPRFPESFENTILTAEKRVVHVTIPAEPA